MSATSCKEPIYDISKSYQENVAAGPHFTGNLPERRWPPKSDWSTFLGFPVASRVGVAAGPLLSASWVAFAARMGYDIVTYKTIRSRSHPGHPLPNILFTKSVGQLDPRQLPRTIVAADTQPENIEQIGITNSFGMPSQDHTFLRRDIPCARASLREGQILVVSVAGTPSDERPLADDFAVAAEFAVECGAPIVEANFSCPNVAGEEGSLYLSPNNAAIVAAKIKAAIDQVPLIVKVGIFQERALLEELLLRLCDAGVAAISGINTLSLSVIDDQGRPALGEKRPTSGICGAPIFSAALQFMTNAREIIDRCSLPLTLIGVGGMMTPEQIRQSLANGADFAQTATGMMWDPYLADKYHRSSP